VVSPEKEFFVMNTIFYNKDFSKTAAQPPADFIVDRYSWNMIGGPQTAYLKAKPNADKWELMKLLRAPIEIYGDDGDIVWWGFVNRITIPIGDQQRLGLGLNELYNYIVVTYNQGDTAAGSDTNSINEYGQKEKFINDTIATQTQGEAKRDLYLLDHKFAKPELEFSGGNDDVSIECYGWNTTLGWKYYSDDTTSNTANETQIESIVTDAGQFLAGTIVEGASGLTSTPLRDGTNTALFYINQLLSAGTSNTQPYLSVVDKNRYLHVYERAAQPLSPEYLLRDDGKLITPLGRVVPDQECKVGAWVKPKGVPSVLGGFSAMSMFFIESAEYNVAQDKTTYRAAGAYDQIRLSLFVAAVASGDSGGNLSGSIGDGTIYNVINPTRFTSALELARATPQNLATVSATMEWEVVSYSRGDAMIWPYFGDEWIKLTKVGYYSFSFSIHIYDIVSDFFKLRLWGADPKFINDYPLFAVDSAREEAGFTQSYISYISSVRTIKMQCLDGTDGMDWIGQLQIAYMGT